MGSIIQRGLIAEILVLRGCDDAKLFRSVEVVYETFKVTLFGLGSSPVSTHQASDEQKEEEGGQPRDARDHVDVVLLVPHLQWYSKFTLQQSLEAILVRRPH